MGKPTVPGLLEFYEGVLVSAGLAVDDNGLVSYAIGGLNTPTTIKDKRLVLPTREFLKEGNWDDYIPFHPLSENIYRTESEVIKFLRNAINLRLMSSLTLLMADLVEIAADKDMHGQLIPKQSSLLTVLDKADAKTYEAFSKIINRVTPTGDRRIVSIYLKRGGKLRGEKYSRVGVVSFPITEEFDNEDTRTIYGVKLRVKDFQGFKNLMEYIIPDCDDLERYSYGSRSLEVPFFDSLLSAYVNVAEQINKKAKLFKKHLPNFDDIYIPLDFASELDNISGYRGLIPTLEGNDGEISIDDKENLDKIEQEEEGRAMFNRPAIEKLAEDTLSSQTVSQTYGRNSVSEPVQKPRREEPQKDELSWSEVMAKKNANMSPWGHPSTPQQPTAWNQPQQMQPVSPPPGFGGAPISSVPPVSNFGGGQVASGRFGGATQGFGQGFNQSPPWNTDPGI